MKKFSPSDDHDYEKSGVINLKITSRDEIEDIYNEIRSMQIRILDYLDDITVIQKEKEKVDKAIGKGITGFAVVMIDVNFLKDINDKLVF